MVTKKVRALTRVRSMALAAALALALELFSFTPTAAADPGYARGSAQQWALANVHGSHKYSEDCTWYVSRALWAGGMAKTPDWTDSSFDLGRVASVKQPGGPTKTAAAPDYLKNYLLDSHQATIRELNWRVNNIPDAQIGDLIGYDWAKNSHSGRPDGIIDHLMIITGFSGQYPLLSGHTNDVSNQGWTWSEASNDWIEHADTVTHNAPRVYLIHITR